MREPGEVFTEDEAIEELREIHATVIPGPGRQYRGDPEQAHIDEDALLIRCLRALGWTRLADFYDAADVERWYA